MSKSNHIFQYTQETEYFALLGKTTVQENRLHTHELIKSIKMQIWFNVEEKWHNLTFSGRYRCID